MKTDDYAEKLLEATLAVETQAEADTKPYSASQLRGIAPSRRSAEEIDAELNAARDEWDNGGTDILEFLARLPQSQSPRAFATWDEYEAFLREEKNAWDR